MMSVPSTEALTIGNFCNASTAALTKNDEKPSLTPCFFSNASLYRLRRSITGCILTSLKVVRIAAFCCDCSRRSAMRWRMRVIATRCSGRLPDGAMAGTACPPSPPPSPIEGEGADLTGCFAFSTSSLVTRPLGPLPCKLLASTSFSRASLRTEGGTAELTAACGAAGRVVAAWAVTAAVSICAITSSLVTFSPSALMILVSTPLLEAGSSSTTLSFSTSIRFSPSMTASPTRLCQVSRVASDTDSDNWGTLTSMMLMVCCSRIRFVVEIVAEGGFDYRFLLFLMHRQITRCGRGGRRTQRVIEAHVLAQMAQQIMLDAMPRALIARLFLAPHHLAGLRIRGDLRHEVIMRERVKLFEADDRHVADAPGTACREQLVIHLAAARDDAAHLVGIQRIDFGYHRLELSMRKFSER